MIQPSVSTNGVRLSARECLPKRFCAVSFQVYADKFFVF